MKRSRHPKKEIEEATGMPKITAGASKSAAAMRGEGCTAPTTIRSAAAVSLHHQYLEHAPQRLEPCSAAQARSRQLHDSQESSGARRGVAMEFEFGMKFKIARRGRRPEGTR